MISIPIIEAKLISPFEKKFWPLIKGSRFQCLWHFHSAHLPSSYIQNGQRQKHRLQCFLQHGQQGPQSLLRNFVFLGWRMKKILHENEPANYTNKMEVVHVLKNAVKNGASKTIQNKHIENKNDMLGKNRIFE